MGLLYYEVTIILHNKLLRQYFCVEWIMSLFSTIVHSELYYTCIFWPNLVDQTGLDQFCNLIPKFLSIIF